MAERKSILLRLDPAVHDALAKWAADEMRSTNAQIEFLLRRALGDSGRMPGGARKMRRPGRPAAAGQAEQDADSQLAGQRVTMSPTEYTGARADRAERVASATDRPNLSG
jgi:hypothetical protein